MRLGTGPREVYGWLGCPGGGGGGVVTRCCRSRGGLTGSSRSVVDTQLDCIYLVVGGVLALFIVGGFCHTEGRKRGRRDTER